MKNVFDKNDKEEIIKRINRLTPATRPQWGKMDVGQMLAHVNVPYEFVFEDKHPKVNPVKRFFLRLFLKDLVVGEKPYSRNSRTAPEFIISGSRDFEAEKNRLISYLNRTQQLGSDYFEGRESRSFGRLSSGEWNNMFYKHLDHHLTQFGV